MLKSTVSDKKSYLELKIMKPIPYSWLKTAGILKSKKMALIKHIKKVRQEWDN